VNGYTQLVSNKAPWLKSWNYHLQRHIHTLYTELALMLLSNEWIWFTNKALKVKDNFVTGLKKKKQSWIIKKGWIATNVRNKTTKCVLFCKYLCLIVIYII
jgi:hypothetical protein